MPRPPRAPAGLGWLAASALLACGPPPELHPFVRAQARPIVVAHGGGGGEGPENTIPAMLASLAADPTTVIELDVQASREGTPVVIHDETVDRTTNGTGRVAALSVDELRRLDAAHCFSPGAPYGTAASEVCRRGDPARFPLRGRGLHRIPTLAEALAALPAGTFLSVDVKGRGAGLVRETAALLRARWPADRLAVGSLDDDVVRALARELPAAAHVAPRFAAACVAVGAKLGADLPSCPPYDVLSLPLEKGGLDFVRRRVVSAAHDRGMAVFSWIANSDCDLARAFEAGADGVITDLPARARALAADRRGVRCP